MWQVSCLRGSHKTVFLRCMLAAWGEISEHGMVGVNEHDMVVVNVSHCGLFAATFGVQHVDLAMGALYAA